MRREDPYTGSPLDDDDDSEFLAADADLYEFDVLDGDIVDEFATDEQVIHFGEIANGAKTLREAAERLYDFADDLIAMSEEGWEVVDDVTLGHATAVQFGIDDGDEP